MVVAVITLKDWYSLTQHVDEMICEMFRSGSPAVVADYLERQNHSAAPVVQCLESPIEALRFLAGEFPISNVLFQLPLPKLEKLDIFIRQVLHDDGDLFSIACDFAEHVLPIYENWNELDPRPRTLMVMMRRWIEGTANDKKLRDSRAELMNYRSQQKLNRIPDAPRLAVRTVLCSSNPWAWAKHCTAEYCAANTAERARCSAGKHEIDWQLEHAERVSRMMV